MAVESSRQSQPNRHARAGQRKQSKEKTGLMRKVLPSLPYVVGGLLLVGYFVWMCIEMSSEAPGGGAVPLSIFGAVLLGVLAGGASILSARRQK
jgi:hypothetical protein